MKRSLIVVAAAVVLAANAWLLLAVAWNRGATPGGRLVLTEREAPLVEMPGESSVVILRVVWGVVPAAGEKEGPPAWLDAAKLAELGFDCGVPVTAAGAARHYRSLPAVEVYVVLELEGNAWRTRSATHPKATRLMAIDAGRDAAVLRSRYPDVAQYAITRGVVGVWLKDRDLRDGTRLAEPRLVGRIETLLPGQVYVPLPHGRVLRGLAPVKRDGEGEGAEVTKPRYAVSVAWGRRYEPWVEDVHPLSADPP